MILDKVVTEWGLTGLAHLAIDGKAMCDPKVRFAKRPYLGGKASPQCPRCTQILLLEILAAL